MLKLKLIALPSLLFFASMSFANEELEKCLENTQEQLEMCVSDGGTEESCRQLVEELEAQCAADHS